MPIQIPGDPFGGSTATNDVQGLKLVDKKPAKYDKYTLISGALQGVAQTVQKKTREMELAQVKEAVNNLEQIRQQRENDPERGWKFAQGKNALERESGKSLRDEVEEGWNLDVQEAMKGVKSSWGRKALNDYVKRATETQRQAIDKHVLQQQTAYQTAVDEQTMGTAQQMIMADDPKTVAQGLQLAETTCASVEQRTGIPVDRTKFLGPMHTTVVGRMVQAGRISEARAYVKKNRGQIGAEDLGRIDQAIKNRQASAAIESMAAADEKANKPETDDRSPNQVILDIRAQNPKATPEQVQATAAKVIANRMQVQAVRQREHEAELGYAYEHVRNGGSLEDFPYFEHMTEAERKAAQDYENKKNTNSLTTNSALYHRLSEDDALGRISWSDLYGHRKDFTDQDFDFLVARKQTLANEGKSQAIPQTFMTAPKAVQPTAFKVDAAVRDALKMNGYVAKDKAHEAIFGRANIVINRIIGDEVRRLGIPEEQVPEYARKRTDQLLKTRLSFTGPAWGWLPAFAGGDYSSAIAALATGETKLRLGSDVERILDAGINAAGIGMPDENSRLEQLLTISLLPSDPIPGASDMAQVIYTTDRTAYEDIVTQVTDIKGFAPNPSQIVRIYLAQKYARTDEVAKAQAEFSKERK